MRYAGIIKNDFAAGMGTCTTFFVQGCPLHCPGCHNPEAQDFNGGKKFTADAIDEIKKALTANGIQRNFCVMGGEPLCEENLFLTQLVITEIKNAFPEIKIYVWTGYEYEHLIKSPNTHLIKILQTIDYLIDGPYVEALKDKTLPMRGSSNQRVIDLHKKI